MSSRNSRGGSAEAFGTPAAYAELPAERMRGALRSPAGAPALLQRRVPGSGAGMVAMEGPGKIPGDQGTRPRGHTTKFIAVAGEEFVTALFLDYLRRCEDKSGEVLIDSEGIPRTPMADLSTREGHKGRPREFDRWISINRGETFIQAEVKSSCAGALGIRSLELRRNPEEVRKFAKNQYEQYFGAQSWFWQDRGWRKLLLKMQQPDECLPEIVRAAPCWLCDQLPKLPGPKFLKAKKSRAVSRCLMDP
jgi:hypothetical protein